MRKNCVYVTVKSATKPVVFRRVIANEGQEKAKARNLTFYSAEVTQLASLT